MRLPAHALNAISPYFTMFPLDFPLNILRRAQRQRDLGIILDPFCGRGTTNFAARLVACPTVGIDCNPVAIATTAAKLVSVQPENVVAEAERILTSSGRVHMPGGEFWELAYDPEVLEQLCKIRESLIADCSSVERIALRALVAGALHGPKNKHGTSYFSNQSPRTYAPKPRYAVGFWKKNKLRAPKVDVLAIIRNRASRYYSASLPDVDAHVVCSDSRIVENVERALAGRRISMVVTSPPYYGLSTYIADQWIRSWFIGADPAVDYSHGKQVSHRSWQRFADDLSQVWTNIAKFAEPDAKLIVRFGGINERKHACPMQTLKYSLCRGPWRIQTIRAAGSAAWGKQQARAFLRSKPNPIPEFDAYCALA